MFTKSLDPSYPGIYSDMQAKPLVIGTSPSAGPSDTLSQVRAHLIESSMHFYELTLDKIISLINEYIGADEAQEEVISKDKAHFSPETLFLARVQRYKEKSMMTVEDRAHTVYWVRTIVASHKKHVRSLPPITLMPGDSEGITFAITRAGKILGFLFGTMHDFSSGLGEAEILTELSLKTQLRLLSCSLIGTEITVKREPTFNSVEGALMAIADRCGIVNVGVDDATVDRSMVGTTMHIGDKETFSSLRWKGPQFKPLDPIEELGSYFKGARDSRTLRRISIIALHSGIAELEWSAALSGPAEDPDGFQCALQRRRNQAMVENMHALLQGCEVIGKETEKEAPPRIFFAIGISHLVPTPAIPKSVVEGLIEKGWGVERLDPEEPQLVSSRTMTEKEAENIGKLIVSMNREPLFASQRPRASKTPQPKRAS